MPELGNVDELAPCKDGTNRVPAITFMAGWPTAYVLEKLGVELRQHYSQLVEEPLPDHLRELAQRLSF